FLSRNMWGMVGRDHVDRAVTQTLPKTNLMPPFPNRRVHTDDRAMVGIGALIEQEIMRAGLAGDIEAAGLGLAHWTNLICRRNVQYMDAGACPLGKDCGARDGFNGDDGRSRG